MPHNVFEIRKAKHEEFAGIGQLMVNVYSQLEGFPKESEQPSYYEMLRNVGELTLKPATEILVAVDNESLIKGAVVYFGDMQYYGSGGNATKEKDSAGLRLLAVANDARRSGIGKMLTIACIEKAKKQGQKQVVIHTTNALQPAWAMYEKMGFKRSEDLDFTQGELAVFGFRLLLAQQNNPI